MHNNKIRLNHYLSNAGISSRRKADQFIQSGAIEVNGKPVRRLGTVIHTNDLVTFYGEKIKIQNKIYLLLNKPKGFITTTKDPFNRKTVMNLIPNLSKYRIFPVGRLDRSTTGVLLLTNDGSIAEKLTHPKSHVQKIYHVLLDKEIKNEDLDQIRKGKIYLKEGKVKVIFVNKGHSKYQIKIGLYIGWNRIIKRIFKKLNYQVIQLDRVNFGGLSKKNIQIGNWCFLNQKEVENILIKK
ncbi:pseudouridylate synthase (ribosomal large subunit pseudouridine synthase B) [Blattabacterium sp. (Blattella germanica) str. Bge]|uniref:pseudouridine synthase n=1 Tax=Blattabacterium sp. (Blattella germanica) TaxID=624186 RepID=UPI0001BB62F5|nr:pseudouridine synthase [Blattabacterium sp. (Blattella germanica)]ACY40117.1 pseudouridylate synthase (ribosomal large subunit pseudouridine synthase B) [Blattabacterium sp. (Blattella germanica) str. Bge]